MKRSLEKICAACGAAGVVVLPQATISSWSQLFSAASPITSYYLPVCTGGCGACGGSCFINFSVMMWLVCCLYLKRKAKHHG